MVYLAAAYRWDSRSALGLALSALAAWRGVSTGLAASAVRPGHVLLESADAEIADLRATAIDLGLLYIAAAALSVRLARKAHFEAVYAGAGLLLLLGALGSGTLGDRPSGPAWLAGLLVVAGAVIWAALRLGRSLYFALAVAAAYLGLLRLLFAPFGHGPRALPFLLAALAGAAALWLIFAGHRWMRAR